LNDAVLDRPFHDDIEPHIFLDVLCSLLLVRVEIF
jgi:hypothetical protein